MPEERKLATVLFADIVQSSDVAQAHDPEVVRRILADLFARMRFVLEAHGGTVEKFIGDAVMTVFGVPVAHDDDAERAVRAAMALRQVISELDRPSALELRIGINSGEVVTGNDEQAPALVTGTPVIVAARLQQSAAPGEILVGELTRRLTGEGIRYGQVRSVSGKGVGPIQAAPVTEIGAHPGHHAVATSSFVGRRRELAMLERAREDARTSGEMRAVVVVGAAGVGKSRLSDEFTRRLAPSRVLQGRCLPYGEGITLWPLQEMIRESAAIAPTDSPQDARAKIAVAVRDALGSAPSPNVEERLAALAAAEPRAADLSPEEVTQDVAFALARYLEGLSRRSDEDPLTIVLDDVHLAQAALLAIIESIASQLAAPLLVIALARPEFAEEHAAWLRGQRWSRLVDVGPLTPSQSERLARSLLEGSSVASDMLSAIVWRAEGNPLYLEELAQVVREHGDPNAVPPSLLAVIAARLDALEPEVKRFLQRASILGRDFWLDAMTDAEDEGSFARVAAEAERRKLVTILGRTGPSGSPTYRFKHLLIREVAYGSTPKSQRAQLHDHYSRWLRTTAGERRREYAEIVAYHAEQAFDAARQIEAPDAPQLGSRAFDALLESATAARDRSDFRATLALAERALAVARNAPIAPSARTKALALAAITRLRLEPSREALALLDRTIDAARAEGPSDTLVRMLVWRAQVDMAEDVDAARRLFDETVRVARALGDDELITYALWVSGQALETSGALTGQARVLHEAREWMTRTGADRWLVDILVDISGNELHLADVESALATAREAATIARAGGTRLQRYKAEVAEARALSAAGNVEAALPVAVAAFEHGRELGGPWALAEGAEVLAELHVARADNASAVRVLEACAAQLDPATMPAMRGRIARIHALLARAHLALGDVARAEESAAAALAAAPASEVRARAVAAAAAAHVEAARGRSRDAKRQIDEALALLEPTGYLALTARVRAEHESLLSNATVRRLTV